MTNWTCSFGIVLKNINTSILDRCVFWYNSNQSAVAQTSRNVSSPNSRQTFARAPFFVASYCRWLHVWIQRDRAHVELCLTLLKLARVHVACVFLQSSLWNVRFFSKKTKKGTYTIYRHRMHIEWTAEVLKAHKLRDPALHNQRTKTVLCIIYLKNNSGLYCRNILYSTSPPVNRCRNSWSWTVES